MFGVSIKDGLATGGTEIIGMPGINGSVGSRIGVHFHSADWIANFFQGNWPGLRPCRGAQVKIRLHQKNASMGQLRKAKISAAGTVPRGGGIAGTNAQRPTSNPPKDRSAVADVECGASASIEIPRNFTGSRRMSELGPPLR